MQQPKPMEIADKVIVHFSQFLFVFFTAAGFYSLLSDDREPHRT